MPSTKGRLSSKIWNHFTRLEGRGQCLYCAVKLSVASGSTGNLKRHLKSHHRNIVQKHYKELEQSYNRSQSQSAPSVSEEAVAVKNLGECMVVERVEDSSFQIEEINDDGTEENASNQLEPKDNSVQKNIRRTYSRIWNHFIKGNGRAKCNYCPANLSLASGSTGNLKRHLKAKHRDIMKGLRDDLRQRKFSSLSPSSRDEEEEQVKVVIQRVQSDEENFFQEEEEEEESAAKDQAPSSSERSEIKCTSHRKMDYDKPKIKHHQFNNAVGNHRGSSTIQSVDECQHFGNFVATKLRKHEGPVRTAIENDIMEVFLKADRGFYNSQNTVIYQTEADTPVSTRNRPNVHFLISSDVLHASTAENANVTGATVTEA